MLYIILATLLYSLAIVLAALAARNANTFVVTSVMNIVSAILPIAVAVPAVMKNGFDNQKTGIFYALLTGIALALFTLAMNKSYAENKIAIVTPIVFGGSIFLSTLLGNYFFKEKISLMQSAGLIVLAVGFLIVIYARLTGK